MSVAVALTCTTAIADAPPEVWFDTLVEVLDEDGLPEQTRLHDFAWLPKEEREAEEVQRLHGRGPVEIAIRTSAHKDDEWFGHLSLEVELLEVATDCDGANSRSRHETHTVSKRRVRDEDELRLALTHSDADRVHLAVVVRLLDRGEVLDVRAEEYRFTRCAP